MAANTRKRSHFKAFGTKRLLCAAAAIICFLPYTMAYQSRSIPPEHMRRDLTQLLSRRQSNGSISLVITNNCTEDIYPALNTQHGSRPSESGFLLQPHNSHTVQVSSNWQGRIWGRTNCTFPNPTAGNKACLTGDCVGALECMVSGIPPVTLAEFTADGGDGKAYYDISLVDGYNLDMAIVHMVEGVSGADAITLAPNRTNPSCVASLANFQSNFWPYTDSNKYLGTDGSSPLPFVQGIDTKKVSKWCPWDCQVNPPKKPGGGVYPYPNTDIVRPIFNPCYSTCAKWNQPEDCCTGAHNTPASCKPGLYSRNIKEICPDAYSFAYDDRDATFVVPKGGNYEIIFCPSGQSTRIIPSEKGVSQKRKTSSASADGSNISWVLAIAALLLTAGLFSML